MHERTRREDRDPVEIDAVVHRHDGSTQTVRLTNFSNEGCRIETEGGLQIGERLQIAIPRIGQMKAQIRWALPGVAGARFLIERDL